MTPICPEEIIAQARDTLLNISLGELRESKVAFFLSGGNHHLNVPLTNSALERLTVSLAKLFVAKLAQDGVFCWEELRATLPFEVTRANPLTARLLSLVLREHFRKTFGITLSTAPSQP